MVLVDLGVLQLDLFEVVKLCPAASFRARGRFSLVPLRPPFLRSPPSLVPAPMLTARISVDLISHSSVGPAAALSPGLVFAAAGDYCSDFRILLVLPSDSGLVAPASRFAVVP
jgi:hypothetical protein